MSPNGTLYAAVLAQHCWELGDWDTMTPSVTCFLCELGLCEACADACAVVHLPFQCYPVLHDIPSFSWSAKGRDMWNSGSRPVCPPHVDDPSRIAPTHFPEIDLMLVLVSPVLHNEACLSTKIMKSRCVWSTKREYVRDLTKGGKGISELVCFNVRTQVSHEYVKVFWKEKNEKQWLVTLSDSSHLQKKVSLASTIIREFSHRNVNS